MRAVVQRVAEARVRVDDRVVGEIASGLLVLLGVGREDGADDVTYVAAKIRDMRIFEGETGRHMERSVRQVGGSVLIERVFAIPGVGRLALDATQGLDYPVLMAIVLMSATAIVFANFLADLTYAFLDPRIRLGS